jgi:hypothetical protein
MLGRLTWGGHRAVVLAAAAVTALLIPVAALAWDQYYAQSTTFNNDGIALSDFNNGLNYNEMNWTSDAPPYPATTGQTTLCDASYNCYSYDSASAVNGFIQDLRTISYGRAKCHSAITNTVPIWVNDCYARN